MWGKIAKFGEIIVICVFEFRKVYFDYEKDIVFECVGCGAALCLQEAGAVVR